MDFSIGSFALNSLWKKPKKTIFTSTKNMRSNWLHFFAKIKFISFYSANKRVKTTSLSPIKIFNSNVFFFFFCVYYTSKKSNQTKMMIGYLNLCIKTDAHFVAVMGHLCGFGCGRCTAIVRSVCDFSAAFVQFWCTIIRSLCDFGATSPSVRLYHKKKCT